MVELTETRTVEGEVIATIDLEAADAFSEGVKLRAVDERGAGFTVGGSDVEGTYTLIRED